MTTDLDLLHKVATGDERALAAIYDRYSTMVYNLVLVHVQEQKAAEEVTQDVFLEVFRSASSFKGAANVKTWLYRIAVNKSLDHIRKEQAKKRSIWKNIIRSENREEIQRKVASNFDHPGVMMEKKEDASALFSAIYQLRDRQKTAFILAFVEQLPRKEVANIMKISDKAVEGLLQRAKSQLRILLKEFDR